MFKKGLAAAAVATLMSAGANASIIDFTSSTGSIGSQPWDAGSFILDTTEGAQEIDVRVEWMPGTSDLTRTTFDADASNSGFVCGPTDAQADCVSDGLGIGDDEIGGRRESLTVSFWQANERVRVGVSEILFLDLFVAPTPEDAAEDFVADREVAIVNNELGNSTSFTAQQVFGDNNSAGGLRGTYNTLAHAVTFSVTGNDDQGRGDFSVAALTFGGDFRTGVPLPGAAWLMLTGLAGFGLARRRTAAANA